MATIKLSKDLPLVLSFDGAVLELFQGISSRRIHVSMLGNMQLSTDKKGKHTLEIDAVANGGVDIYEADEEAFPKVALIIAQVEKAKGAFRFD